MGKILYGVCGEGLGHAARVMTVVNQLRNHQFVIFAARDAFAYLKKNLSESDDVRVEPIPGLNFRYLFKRISYCLSLASSLKYIFSISKYVEEMERKIDRFDPDLVITDFEPLSARLAARRSLPLLSLDHQHFITELDVGKLPWGWRTRVQVMRFFVRQHYDWQVRTVVSSFFARCFESTERVEHVGVAVRDDMKVRVPSESPYLVVYLRNFHPQKILSILEKRSEKYLIYGRHEPSIKRNLIFKPLDNITFCRDLAKCRGLICNAGNQLIGEAFSLGKPVLAVPESGNLEQQLNGHFLNQMGGGLSLPYRKVNQQAVAEFVEKLDETKNLIDRQAVVGNDRIMQIVAEMIGPTSVHHKPSQPASISA